MFPDTNTLPVTNNGPVLISTVPYKVCTSLAASPNWLLPLESAEGL